MAGAESFSAGNDAFVDEEYELAKEEYSKAINQDSSNHGYFLKRSICNFKLQDYEGSASDAESSTKIFAKNPKAFLRLGLARFQLQQFLAAKEAFHNVLLLDGQNKEALDWIKKCEANLPAAAIAPGSDQPTGEMDKSAASCDQAANAEPKEEKANPTSAIKYDWYQTETHVVLTLMIKNRKKEDVEIEFGKRNVSITVKLSSDNDYNWEIDLAHSIEPKHSIMRILSTKIEIKLKKAEGIRWALLEGQDGPVYATLTDPETGTVSHQYPSSSKRYHDWDKLAANIEKDESEEKKEGDAALNELFQKIYSNADEDTKRAMNKSYQESGGTVLSTNWKDIGKQKVECKPPDGMEYKKYEI